MRQRRRLAVALVLVLVLIGALSVGIVIVSGPAPLTPEEIAALAAKAAARRLLAQETKSVVAAKRLVAVALPRKEGAQAPSESSALYVTPLPSHEVIGFVPYWELSSLSAADFADASELVYSGVCPSPTGGLADTVGDCRHDLSGLASAPFDALVASAHGVGDRVLLSVTTTSASVIHALDASPAKAATNLASALEAIVGSHRLDGINIDIEGSSANDERGFVGFVTDLVRRLRALDPPGEIVIDTYAASAASGAGFFDVRSLAPLVDQVFLMAYDLYSPYDASANSPLSSPTLGYSVVQSLIQYEKLVPAKKIVLGLPFYGDDFETTTSRPGAATVSSAPEAFSYSAISSAKYPARWDVSSETPYSVFRRSAKWHEIWFDDAVSLALKTAAASALHVAGVGAWAFGMEGNDEALLLALDGGSTPQRAALSPPP